MAKQVCIAASGSLDYAEHVRAEGHDSSSALVIQDTTVTCKDLHSFGCLTMVSVGLQVI